VWSGEILRIILKVETIKMALQLIHTPGEILREKVKDLPAGMHLHTNYGHMI